MPNVRRSLSIAGVKTIPAILLALLIHNSTTAAAPLVGAAASGLDGKIIVGYQGWFGCPGDFPGNTSWLHWFSGNSPDAAHIRVDLLPEIGEYPTAGLCSTALKRQDGTPIELFTSENLGVVETHFQWMSAYGIDGASVERFVGGTENSQMRARFDQRLTSEKRAAETAGRVFFISYDVSGAGPGVVAAIRRDWQHVVADLKVTDSPSYLHDQGKPVLEIWGFGVRGRPGEPGGVAGLLRDLKNGANGLAAAYVIGGVAPGWRDLSGRAAQKDPAWATVYPLYDVISPWFVGRFQEPDAAHYLRSHLSPDLAETRRLGIGYMPVAFPGFSWSNQTQLLGHPAPLNEIPRQCGRLYWRQIRTELDEGVSAIYVAMFDEVDEGTAIFKVATGKAELPVGTQMVYLDEDGCSLPDDWYLRITALASRYLKSHTVPPHELSAVLPPTINGGTRP